MAEKNLYTQKNVNFQEDVAALVESEVIRRRNGNNGFSRTVNQMLLEWADWHNAEMIPVDTHKLQDLPAVEKICVPAETEA
jgi:hypothetical protein